MKSLIPKVICAGFVHWRPDPLFRLNFNSTCFKLLTQRALCNPGGWHLRVPPELFVNASVWRKGPCDSGVLLHSDGLILVRARRLWMRAWVIRVDGPMLTAMLTDPARRVWWGPAAELAGNGCDDAPDSCVSDGVVGGDKTLSLIAAE